MPRSRSRPMPRRPPRSPRVARAAPPRKAADMLFALGNLGRHLGVRTRKVVRYLGFAVVGVLTFVFALQLTFPFDRVKDRLIEQLSDKYDVSIGGVERGIIPGRMYFKAVSVRTRPTKAGDVATTTYLDQLEVDLKIGPGHLTGRFAQSGEGISVHAAGADLASANLPVREALGLPMSGKIRLSLDLDLPYEKARGTGKVSANYAKAEGGLEFACPSGCTVGDGKSKLKLTTNNARQQEFLDSSGGGIDFGKVAIDSLLAKVEVKNGRLEITRFELRSGDGEAHVAFSMAINQDIQSSLVTGCLRFHGSEALRRREPKTDAALSTTGGPLGPDSLFHIKLDGPLRQVRRLPQVCGPATNTSMDNPGAPPPRPNITVTPETTPPRPPGPGIVAQPPQPPPLQPATPPQQPQPMPPAAGSAQTPPIGEGPPPIVYPSGGSGMPQPAQGSGFAPLPTPPPNTAP
ncbi:MAG: type II secretion system protein GspN, partial [Deltaproteobacteria bacterium]